MTYVTNLNSRLYIEKAVEEENFNLILQYTSSDKNSLVFRVLIEKNRLDYLKMLFHMKYFITCGNVTYALKKGKYEIVKWAISLHTFPNVLSCYEDANKTNNFEIIQLMVESGIYKISKVAAKYAYERNWKNVTIWLEARGVILDVFDRNVIDAKKKAFGIAKRVRSQLGSARRKKLQVSEKLQVFNELYVSNELQIISEIEIQDRVSSPEIQFFEFQDGISSLEIIPEVTSEAESETDSKNNAECNFEIDFCKDKEQIMDILKIINLPEDILVTEPVPIPSAIPVTISTTDSITSTSFKEFDSTFVPTNIPSAVPPGFSTQVSIQVSTQGPTNIPTAVPPGFSTQVPTQVSTQIPTQVSTNIPTAVPSGFSTQVSTQVSTSTFSPVSTSIIENNSVNYNIEVKPEIKRVKPPVKCNLTTSNCTSKDNDPGKTLPYENLMTFDVPLQRTNFSSESKKRVNSSSESSKRIKVDKEINNQVEERILFSILGDESSEFLSRFSNISECNNPLNSLNSPPSSTENYSIEEEKYIHSLLNENYF